MKRKILEPKDYKKLCDAVTQVVLLAALAIAFAVYVVAARATSNHSYEWIIIGVCFVLMWVLWFGLSWVLFHFCAWVLGKFFDPMDWPCAVWPNVDGEYTGVGTAGRIMSFAIRDGCGVQFLARRVVAVDVTGRDFEKMFFVSREVDCGACCLICYHKNGVKVLQQMGARHLGTRRSGGDVFELGRFIDVQHLYKKLLDVGEWVLLCGVKVDFPRVPQVWGYPGHPEAMDIYRILNRASLVICSGEADEVWQLCWDNGEISRRNYRAFVLKWPPDEWYMEHATQEYGVFSFITKAVGADKVAAVHEISGRPKDWRMYGLASRDWAQLARRAEKSGEVFFSLRVPAEQVLQAWRGGGCYVDVENAEEAHALSGDAGFSAMLDAIMPEGGCVLSCSHDAEYVYVWARGV